MTIHAAKGLEFPYVFVTGLEENLFPSSMSMSSRAELEEERRLFYVAVTRAMNKLTLSYAAMRMKWGELNFCTPSRFLDELDSSLLDIPQKFSHGLKLKSKNNLSYPADDSFDSFPAKDKKAEETSYVFRKKVLVNNDKELQKKLKSDSKPAMIFDNSEIADIGKIVEGIRIEHARFGQGTVIQVEGKGQDKKATIEFDSAGKKLLVLRFARLKIIEN
jgi:DNA helicase-2/ATP-dependent DNA helicase PcrA